MGLLPLKARRRTTTSKSTRGSEAAPTPRVPPDPEHKRRYRGCLLGGAVGDALGAPVEFMSREEILARFGAAGIAEMTTAFDRRGAITDDTQMSLFTAEGLLRSQTRRALSGTSADVPAIAAAYLRWLKSQGIVSPLLPETGPAGLLLEEKALHERRVPGHTCLSALELMRVLGDKARNDSKGCGGVMRVAPVGLHCARDPGASPDRAMRRAFDLGCEVAALTHGHPTGQTAAGAFAGIVAQVVRGASVPAAIAAVRPLVARRPLASETLRGMDNAIALATEGPADASKVARLGEGWVADEALAIALYASLAAETFEQGVLVAVNHDGDSDSTGAIAGNLLGALLGIDQIPRRWLAHLELGELIAAVADDLATWPDWPLGEFVPEVEATGYWLNRYPPA